MTVLSRDMKKQMPDVDRLEQHYVVSRGKKYLDTTAQTGLCPLGLNANILEQSLDLLKEIPTLQYKNFDYELIRQADGVLLEDSHFTHTYWTLSSSLACEAAVKMVYRITGKKGIIGIPHGYNGSSMVANTINYNVPRNQYYNDLSTIKNYFCNDIIQSIEMFHDKCSAVILEPLLYQQGLESPGDLQLISRACKKHGLFLIVDETFTGYYRTGPKWFHQTKRVEPDLLITGKGINNGACGVGCVLINYSTYKKLESATGGKFEFWQTAAGSPVCCASVLVCMSQLKQLAGQHLYSLPAIQGLTEQLAFNQGYIIKVKDEKIVCSPPYTWSKNEIQQLDRFVKK